MKDLLNVFELAISNAFNGGSEFNMGFILDAAHELNCDINLDEVEIMFNCHIASVYG